MVTEIEKRQAGKLDLETLGRGIRHINGGHSLLKTIEFLSTLNHPISIETGVSEEKMEIIFPTKLFSKENKDWDSIAIITNQLGTYMSITDPKGSRQLLYPTEFIAAITLNKDVENEFGLLLVNKIELSTKLSERKAKSAIKEVLRKIPKNWQFNPRPAPRQKV